MANTVNLEFAGDAAKLARAAKQAEQATTGVGQAATEANDDFRRAASGSDQFATRMGGLGAAVDGASTAIGDAAGTVQALADVQSAAYNKAQRLARAASDVAQAQEDMAQATRDAKQAQIDSSQAAVDLEQAHLDQATALKEYNQAVKEHGKGSDEAKQAQINLKQAGVDVQQAQEDAAQAIRDGSQAAIDAKSAQLDLNDAQRAANPTNLQGWADQINMVTPILTGLVGVVGLVTAAQWAWNIAQLASPTTWIILAIVALIAVIVLIATKTTWFQDLWRVAWGGIKDAASAVGSWFKDTLWGKWIKGSFNAIRDKSAEITATLLSIPGKLRAAFSKVTNFIFSPFRAAFNMVSTAWNNTVGRLYWSVPGWVPGLGGASISAPQLPKFHSGGVVPGTPGSEVMAVLQAGERVTPVTGSSATGGSDEWVHVDLGDLGTVLLDVIARAVQRRGGSVTALGVRVVGGTVR